MVQNPPLRLSCPGCERKNFRSIVGVRNHFIKKQHSFQCPACEKSFKDELGVIQHYQKYASPSSPSHIRRIQPSEPLPSEPLPSAAAAPILRPEAFQMDAPDETSRAPSQEPENPNCYLVHSLLNTIPVTELESPVLPEDSPVVTSQTLVYSTVLDPLEQNLILRYLHSRCHSWNRLQTEGYVLGSGPHEVKRTPSKASIEIYDFRSPPHTNIQAAGRINAIAIDCEMVGVRKGCQTLAFISAINFLTGEVLISRFVDPVEDVVDWRTKFSGITKTIMASAIISGAAFRSWREARDKLWEYMDDSTILVGHSLNHDLEVLGMFHAKVVDSAILTAETVFPSIIPTKRLTRMWGLKRLAKDLLNLDIQTSNRGHNALEDSYAARDIVIWCIRNPEELKLWAENARHQEEERKAAQSRNRHGKGRSKGKLPTIRSTQNWEYDSENDDYSEGFRLSDLAEELGWPQGYDPWSD